MYRPAVLVPTVLRVEERNELDDAVPRRLSGAPNVEQRLDESNHCDRGPARGGDGRLRSQSFSNRSSTRSRGLTACLLSGCSSKRPRRGRGDPNRRAARISRPSTSGSSDGTTASPLAPSCWRCSCSLLVRDKNARRSRSSVSPDSPASTASCAASNRCFSRSASTRAVTCSRRGQARPGHERFEERPAGIEPREAERGRSLREVFDGRCAERGRGKVFLDGLVHEPQAIAIAHQHAVVDGLAHEQLGRIVLRHEGFRFERKFPLLFALAIRGGQRLGDLLQQCRLAGDSGAGIRHRSASLASTGFLMSA